MPPSTIHSPPALDSFTSLSDHQTQTPATFFGATPVLHYHATGARALAQRHLLSKLPILTQDGGTNGNASSNTGTETEGSASDNIVESIDIFASSESLTLFNPATSTGLTIPYPNISLHAIQRLDDPSDATQQLQGLYMQLELSDPNAGMGEDEDMDIVELTLIPPPLVSESGPSAIQSLFEAVSNCSNLHPDPGFQDDEEMGEGDGDSRIVFEGSIGYEGISGLPGVQRGAADGGLPPPFPGSGGWITAENVSEYFDTEGNWIGEGGNGPTLGEGAGRVRPRDEVDDYSVNGHGETDSDDNKRARTDG
ncbi:hypothetical protein HYFRA_00003875 [Hymenoscyphus fraxineus]|uniref:Benzoylformate decarboxylase n=1 Tax=Hymenoscyphus fraxineus TaxID=746836 RepID=A0A9N9KZ27_9HELO|nr:hypothetical protein HYFRA_00003875 [Hymenoscyphus fraxineus]